MNVLWQRFFENILPALSEAGRTINEEMHEHYKARDGWYGKLRQDERHYPLEEAISQALSEVLMGMRADQILQSPCDAPFDLIKVEIGSEVPRKYDPRIGKRSQPTDLMLAIAQDRIDFRIETKNVRTNGDITGAYIGADGLGRFDEAASPYTLEAFGGMLAYVVDQDVAYWSHAVATTLKQRFDNRQLGELGIGEDVHVTTIHERDIDLPLFKIRGRYRTEVIHLVLEFDANPSRRNRHAA